MADSRRLHIVPFRQLLQLHETERCAQFVHPVVEAQDRHVVVRTAAVEPLSRATRHPVSAGLPDGFAQGAAARNDRAPLGGGHVLVSVETECCGFTIAADFGQSGRMSCVLNQEQAFSAGKGLPGVAVGKVAGKMHQDNGLGPRRALCFCVVQRHQRNVRRSDIDEDRSGADIENAVGCCDEGQ